MAHVHGSKAVADAGKKLAEAGAHKMMEHGMMTGMSHGIQKVAPAAMSFHNLAKGAAASGAAVAASSQTGRSLVSRILKHPLVWFGIGAAVGYTVHKYRKEIISAANRAAEQGKDFVLQQRENLEDIIAEKNESAE